MKKFRIAALAAAGIMAATAITTSAVAASREEEVKLTEFEEQLLCGIYPHEEMSPEERANAEEQYNAALLLENGIIDSIHPDDTIVGEDGLTDRERELEDIINNGKKPASVTEQYKDELDAILAARESDVTLTLVQSTPYVLWSGRNIYEGLVGQVVRYNSPTYFSIKNAPGDSVEMNAKSDYKGRFKSLTVYYTYKNNSTGEIKKTKASKEGTGSLTVNPSSVSNSTLVEVACYFNVYKGDTTNTEFDEVAVVHLVDKAYSQSAQYAENSYAFMIDQYTYIAD